MIFCFTLDVDREKEKERKNNSSLEKQMWANESTSKKREFFFKHIRTSLHSDCVHDYSSFHCKDCFFFLNIYVVLSPRFLFFYCLSSLTFRLSFTILIFMGTHFYFYFYCRMQETPSIVLVKQNHKTSENTSSLLTCHLYLEL